MKIAEIRNVIDSLNWARQEFTGGTSTENRRARLDTILAPHIGAVKALEIAPRFARDIQDQQDAIRYAELALARWSASQETSGEKTDSVSA